MLWKVTSQAAHDDWSKLSPRRSLFDYGEPLLFTVEDKEGGLSLAYLCDDSEDQLPLIRRYFVAVTSTAIVEALESGACSMREALDQPRTWLVDVGDDWKVERCWRATVAEMPKDALPPPGVMLRPELEPLLSLRAVGETIGRGAIPGEIIKHLVTGVEGALKRLLDYTLDREGTGRVPNSVRQFYALPAQSFAFSSFQIGFADPTQRQLTFGEEFDGKDLEAFKSSLELLSEGLDWARDGFPKEKIAGTDRQRAQAIMEALRALTPSSHGKIERLEIGGSLREGRHVSFSRESRSEVTTLLRELKQPKPVPFDDVGLVRQLDLDALTFALRERASEEQEVQCSFEQDDLDSILNAFNLKERVRVLGVKPPGSKVVDVLLIAGVDDESAELPGHDDSDH